MKNMMGGGALPPRPKWVQVARGLVGGFLGILLLAVLGKSTGVPWLMAPFGASCVILFAASSSPFAQPRNVVGGHLVTSAVGMAALYLFGASPLVMALAVGLSIALMQLLRMVHPPAGANPVVILLAGKAAIGISYLVTPVLMGSISLVIVALVVNNIGVNTEWPVYWLGRKYKRDN